MISSASELPVAGSPPSPSASATTTTPSAALTAAQSTAGWAASAFSMARSSSAPDSRAVAGTPMCTRSSPRHTWRPR